MNFLKTIIVNLILVALTCSAQDSSSLDSISSETSSFSSKSTVESISSSQSSAQPSLETQNESQSSTSSQSSAESSSADSEPSVSETVSSQSSSETSINSQTFSDSQSSTESSVTSISSSDLETSSSVGISTETSIDSKSPSDPQSSISSSESSIESQSPIESSNVASSESQQQSASQISSESILIESTIESQSSESLAESTINFESFSVPPPSFMEPEESSESFASSELASDVSSPTEPELSSLESSETSGECFIPDCRWCDHLDLATCECFRVAVDCMIGSALSEDGCSCIPIPGWNNSVPEEPSTEPEVSETELSSSPCFPIECPRKMFWNQSTCSCECLKKKMCKKHLEFNPSTCECEHMTTTKPALNTTTPFVCSLPSCRPCDLLDEDNCVCHKTFLDCSPGFELSADKCECIKIESSESSESEIMESSSACAIPPCRPCDILDVENCVCHHKIVDCAEGYELSDDRCGCEKSVSTSDKCPGLECPEDTYIDEQRCECINEECKSAKACRKNLVMDPKSCECFCNLSPWQCKYPQIFDRKNCKCSHKSYHEEDEDPENCDYECVQKERCHKNFIFDYNKCECVCDSRKAAKKCPEGTKFDKSVCECVECLDFDDPQCTCDCDEILDCPGDQIFNFIGCECMCPEIYCEKGFEMDKRTCECVWRGYGKQHKYGGLGGHSKHNGHSKKGGY